MGRKVDQADVANISLDFSEVGDVFEGDFFDAMRRDMGDCEDWLGEGVRQLVMTQHVCLLKRVAKLETTLNLPHAAFRRSIPMSPRAFARPSLESESDLDVPVR